HLITRMLNETDIHRIRISSVEPGDFSLDWLELWQDKRLCAHLHVPLQSGSARVLQAMRRKYTPTAFLAMIDAARCAIDNLAVTTDVITGFPGETQGDFEDGFRLIESCEFDGMHVFPYSRRPGTAAAALGDTVSEADKKQRAAQLREIGEAGRRRHIDRNLGHRHEV